MCPFSVRCALLLLWVSACAAVQAQSNATMAPAPVERATPEGRSQKLIEVMRTESGNSIIEEVRIGGETHSIAVQPKGGMPAYEILPASGTRNRTQFELEGAAGANPASGPRVWKLFDF